MKDELLKIAQEVLTEEEVQEIVKEKFKDAFKNAVGEAFRWGDAERALKNSRFPGFKRRRQGKLCAP